MPSYDPSIHLAIVITENSTIVEHLVRSLGMTGLEEMTHRRTGEIICGRGVFYREQQTSYPETIGWGHRSLRHVRVETGCVLSVTEARPRSRSLGQDRT